MPSQIRAFQRFAITRSYLETSRELNEKYGNRHADKRWAEMLRLKNMKFLIMSVPVINAAEVKRNYTGVKDGIFDALRRFPLAALSRCCGCVSW